MTLVPAHLWRAYQTAHKLEALRALDPAQGAWFDQRLAQLLSRDPAQIAAATADLQRALDHPDVPLDPVAAAAAEAEAQAMAQIAALHRQLRAFLAERGAPPEHLATALGYELVSVAACVSDTPEMAQAHLANFCDAAHAQLADHGVGGPHPYLDASPDASPDDTPDDARDAS